MHRAKRWRYYCDHCGRSKGTKPSMMLHESGCTKNPARVCRMCLAAGLKQRAANEVDAAVQYWSNDALDQLRKATGGCPACMLAALLRHTGAMMSIHFDYLKEKTEFWDEHNRLCSENDYM